MLSAVCDFLFLCYLSLWRQILEVTQIQKYFQVTRIIFEKYLFKSRCLKLLLNDKQNDIVER